MSARLTDGGNVWGVVGFFCVNQFIGVGVSLSGSSPGSKLDSQDQSMLWSSSRVEVTLIGVPVIAIEWIRIQV